MRIYSFLYIFLHTRGVFVWFNSFVIQENPEFNQFSGSGREGGLGGIWSENEAQVNAGRCEPPSQHVGPRPREESATKFVELTARCRPAAFWCDTHKLIVFN